MAVPDDLRRLSEMQGIYLGLTLNGAFTVWYESRLQQTNDGSWISSSRDGTIVTFQLQPQIQNWTSQDTPTEGLTVYWNFPVVPNFPLIGTVQLRQQLPQSVTN